MCNRNMRAGLVLKQQSQKLSNDSGASDSAFCAVVMLFLEAFS